MVAYHPGGFVREEEGTEDEEEGGGGGGGGRERESREGSVRRRDRRDTPRDRYKMRDKTRDMVSPLELTELLPKDNQSSSSSSCRPHTPTVPLSAVEELVETVVVLRKDHRTHELGISVVGGSDTYLGCVVIERVAEGGPAWSDGRLKRGDILLQVNDTPLVQITNEEAVAALRLSSSPVRLLVLREDPEKIFTTHKEPTKFLTVELRKSAMTERLGLSLMERSDGNGIFVTLVEPGGLAALYGRIMQGDKLLEVNGVPTAYLSLAQVANQLRGMEGSVVLLLGRIPSLSQAIHEWARTESRIHVPVRLRIHTWSHSRSVRYELQPFYIEDTEGRPTGGGGGGGGVTERGSGGGGGGIGGVAFRRVSSQGHHYRIKSRTASTSACSSGIGSSSSSSKLPRPPASLLHVLRRSLKGRSSAQAIVRTCTPDSAQALLSHSTPPLPGGSPQTHVRFHGSEVISIADTESCSSDKSFL